MFNSLGYQIEKIEGINPYRSWKLLIFLAFNLLTFGYFNCSQYLEYACIAKPK